MYAGVTYYDGQGVLVRKGTIASAIELDGGAICTNQGSRPAQPGRFLPCANKVSNEVITFATVQEAANAYEVRAVATPGAPTPASGRRCAAR